MAVAAGLASDENCVHSTWLVPQALRQTDHVHPMWHVLQIRRPPALIMGGAAGLASTQYFDLLCSTVAKSCLAAQHLSRREALSMITRQLAAHVGLVLMADVQTLLLPSDTDLFGVFSACSNAPSLRSAEALPHYAVQRMAELLGSVRVFPSLPHLPEAGLSYCTSVVHLYRTALYRTTLHLCIRVPLQLDFPPVQQLSAKVVLV